MPARGFSGPERVVLSAQVFHSAADTSEGSVQTEVGQPEKQAFFSRCFLCLGFPHGQFQGQTSPLGEMGIVPLYHASHDAYARSWFPHGNERMTGRERRREGKRGGEGRGGILSGAGAALAVRRQESHTASSKLSFSHAKQESCC